MDLGPVVGSNISFFGEQLGCKILVEDLFAVVESHSKAGTRDALSVALVTRLTREPASMDGIFCWDLFDFLDRYVVLKDVLVVPFGIILQVPYHVDHSVLTDWQGAD